ncbi:MAG: hypothetical protein K0R22_3375 [Sporomusa sp.]|jgi:hypothetical protein|nr:hypothetical protein [Sporomusa sp.]
MNLIIDSKSAIETWNLNCFVSRRITITSCIQLRDELLLVPFSIIQENAVSRYLGINFSWEFISYFAWLKTNGQMMCYYS